MAEQPKPKVPMGAPLEWSDEDLDALAEVTPRDIQAAQERWRTRAPKRYRNLLDATADPQPTP